MRRRPSSSSDAGARWKASSAVRAKAIAPSCIAARAVAWAKGVIFLDEPTAALGVVQTKNVLETIRRVRDKGVGVVFISHSMPHVIEVADRVQVLRLGRRVATYEAKKTSVEELVGAMTGALDGAHS